VLPAKRPRFHPRHFNYNTIAAFQVSTAAQFNIIFPLHLRLYNQFYSIAQQPSVQLGLTTSNDRREIQVLTLLTFTLEVVCSHLGPDTGYPERLLSWSTSVPQENDTTLTQITPIPPPSLSLQIHHSPIILPFDAI
jgi:hypothetical protein